ncbi:MAG: hypothetical protein RBG13Loki_1540 [Promethearchaeota archaeon CR_4]|nr:MAG: hypothetical protein RBG13Loki_1540 [Candidatus Lokiarchaeota archaeon CR_4]
MILHIQGHETTYIGPRDFARIMGRKWVNVGIPAEMHAKIVALIENPAIKAKYAFGTPSEFIRRIASGKLVELERELRDELPPPSSESADEE